jgi:hypothetical protein
MEPDYALKELWYRLRDKKINEIVGKEGFEGLHSVPFSKPLEEFSDSFYHQVRSIWGNELAEAKVFTSTEDLLDYLNNKDILGSHLSCAGRISFVKDASLTVFSITPKTLQDRLFRRRKPLYISTLPGITYTPTDETLQFIRERKTYDYTNYVDRFQN